MCVRRLRRKAGALPPQRSVVVHRPRILPGSKQARQKSERGEVTDRARGEGGTGAASSFFYNIAREKWGQGQQKRDSVFAEPYENNIFDAGLRPLLYTYTQRVSLQGAQNVPGKRG